jgi:hypothetical protein
MLTERNTNTKKSFTCSALRISCRRKRTKQRKKEWISYVEAVSVDLSQLWRKNKIEKKEDLLFQGMYGNKIWNCTERSLGTRVLLFCSQGTVLLKDINDKLASVNLPFDIRTPGIKDKLPILWKLLWTADPWRQPLYLAYLSLRKNKAALLTTEVGTKLTLFSTQQRSVWSLNVYYSKEYLKSTLLSL